MTTLEFNSMVETCIGRVRQMRSKDQYSTKTLEKAGYTVGITKEKALLLATAIEIKSACKLLVDGDNANLDPVLKMAFSVAERYYEFEPLMVKIRETLTKKGHDYANDDAMSNFKKISAITETQPLLVIMTFAASKISRACNLIDSGKVPENESLQDSILDLACYSVLALAMQEASKQVFTK